MAQKFYDFCAFLALFWHNPCYNGFTMKISGNKTVSKPLAALLTLGAAVLFALFLAGLLLFSANYQKIYHSAPAAEGAVMDFDGYLVTNNNVSSILEGEWEFFYGRWIVTDGDAGESDGYISVPGRWTGREFHGEKLPRSGYASYRAVLKHLDPDLPLFVFRVNYSTPYRVFLNGRLNVVSGTLGREKGEGKVTGSVDELYPYLSDGGDIEVVIELGYTETGGLNASPWLGVQTGGNDLGQFMRNFELSLLGFATAVVLASVMFTAGLYRYQGELSLPFLVFSLLMVLLFSKDVAPRIDIPFAVTLRAGIAARAVLFVILLWHLKEAGAALGRRELLGYGALFAVTAVLFGTLYGTNTFLFPAALVPLGVLSLCYFTLRGEMKPRFKAVYCALLFVLACMFAFELSEGAGIVKFGTELFLSVLTTVMIALFAAVGFFRIRGAARDLLRASELEQELQRVKQQALKAQIKPHFVFNSLTAIQSLYHKDVREGDEALERFARHLRLNVDADGTELVPFEQEIRNILNYFELENMRLGGKLTLLLDVNRTDFSVPVLSLQPLVENAIRHGGTAREGGYISIATNGTEEGVEIVISDNGRGFDPAEVPEGVGLTNSRERLKGLIGAEMRLESKPGEGTTITISLPIQGENQ